LAQEESKAERGDDLFDLARDHPHKSKVAIPAIARGALDRALARTMSTACEPSDEDDEQRDGRTEQGKVDQPGNWKAAYAHKLLKRGKWNELDKDPGDGNAAVTTYSKRTKKRKFVQDNVTAAMSPSGRVKIDIRKDSDDSDLPGENEDYDDW